jgi:hypothetical protein
VKNKIRSTDFTDFTDFDGMAAGSITVKISPQIAQIAQILFTE